MKAIKKTFAASILAFCQTAHAQQQPFPTNPVGYGFWKISTSNGLTGEVDISERYCQYNIFSNFSYVSSSCRISWDANLNRLSIVGDQTSASFSVPDYQPNRKIVTTAGIGLPRYSFSLTKIRPNSMSGHILGAGQNVTVTFKRH